MIRQAKIPVMIHFRPKESGNHCDVLQNKKGAFTFDVSIEEPTNDRKAMVALAHELGHLVAHIFQTRAARNDPRRSGQPVWSMNRKKIQAVCANEKEAWKIARRIYPRVDRTEEAGALRLYKEVAKVEQAKLLQLWSMKHKGKLTRTEIDRIYAKAAR